MVIKPNASIAISTIMDLIGAISDENRFSLISKPKDLLPSTICLSNGQEQWDIVEAQRKKWISKEKFFGLDFFVYLVEGMRDSIENEILYVYSIDLNANSFKKIMEFQDAPF